MSTVKRKITIISYHSITADPYIYGITLGTFKRQMEFIKNTYEIIKLNKICDAFGGKEKDIRKLVITFDDSFSDFFEVAYPTLKRLSIPCTVFIPTGFVGRFNMWDMHEKFFRRINVMNNQQLLALSQECMVDFGSHTVNHVSMRNLSTKAMIQEAADSKKWLEGFFNRKINMFAYPYGQLDDISKKTTETLLDMGYEIAVSSRWGTVQCSKDILKLKRIFFNEKDGYKDLKDKIEGRYDWFRVKERTGFLCRQARRRI